MASAHHVEIFNCTPQEFFNIAVDYEKYPEFLTEVKSCKIVKSEGDSKLVDYKVTLIKSVQYQLKTKEVAPSLVAWEFAGGDGFKAMNGSWKIEDAGEGKCRCYYDVEATFKIFVPGPVATTVLKVNLPAMMAAYHKRIKTVYGK